MQYLNEYHTLHAQRKFPGHSLLQWIPRITDMVAEHQSRKLLDYGCGEGRQWTHERAHLAIGVEQPALYDPAVHVFARIPDGVFDGVICTDVLEHVPEDELDGVFADLERLSRQWVFASICCRPSKHMRFSDGSNIHCTLHPMEWWRERMAPHFTKKLVLVESP